MAASPLMSSSTPAAFAAAQPLASVRPSRRADDALLIRQAQDGDHGAFEQLVRQYDHAVLRLALHITGSEADAQDIYQEAFLKAYRMLGSFRFECSFYTWIYRIVANLCVDHLRRRRARREDPGTEVRGDGYELDRIAGFADTRTGSNPERELLRLELADRIARAMSGLSPRERTVFELKHYHGLRLRMVAELMQTTEGTAKNILFRATHKLRAALANGH